MLFTMSDLSSNSYSKYYHLFIFKSTQEQMRNSILFPPSKMMIALRGLTKICGSVSGVTLIFM